MMCACICVRYQRENIKGGVSGAHLEANSFEIVKIRFDDGFLRSAPLRLEGGVTPLGLT